MRALRRSVTLVGVLGAPTRAPSDERLVRRAAEGDEQAFALLYERYAPRLLSFCRYVLGSRDEAQDAVQQTFLRAHRAITAGNPPQAVRPWLYTVARNRCRSMLAGRRELPLDEVRDGVALDGLADVVQRREDLRALVRDLDRLPQDQRAALVMFELGDLSQRDIAGVLEVPEPKVKALVHQARAHLIAERAARDRSCEDVRAELAVARGAALRRGPLRRHVRSCAACMAWQAQLDSQRVALGVVLPVALLGTRHAALTAFGAGSAGAAASGVTTGAVTGGAIGAAVQTGVAVKVVAAVTAIAATGAGVVGAGAVARPTATVTAVAAAPASTAPATAKRRAPAAATTAPAGAKRDAPAPAAAIPPAAVTATAPTVAASPAAAATPPAATMPPAATTPPADGAPPAAPTAAEPAASPATTTTAAAPATTSAPAALPTEKPEPPGHAKKPEPVAKQEPPGHVEKPEPPGHSEKPEPPGHAAKPEPPGHAEKPEPPGNSGGKGKP